MLQCACKLVLLTRLREPFTWYRSFWDWSGVARKQQKNSSEWGESLVEFATAYRNLQSMLFMGRVNRGLEAQYLGARVNTEGLDKYRCFEHSADGKWRHSQVSAATAADCNEGMPGRIEAPRVFLVGRPLQQSSILKVAPAPPQSVQEMRVALRAFDVVGLVERFDETLLLVADLSGLQHVLHRASELLSSQPKPS